jgi:hypothetical protein
VVGVLPGQRAAADDHLGAVRAQDVGLLLGRAVGHDNHHPVAALPADDRQADPGIARRGLDDGAAGAEQPVALGRLDHRPRGPVLDAPAHAVELGLRVDRGRDAVPEPPQPEERGAADRVGDGFKDRRHRPGRVLGHTTRLGNFLYCR